MQTITGTLESMVAIKVAVIEEYALYARALGHMFSQASGMELVAEQSLFDVTLLQVTQPHILVIDIDSPNIDLSNIMMLCRRHLPDVAVCVFTSTLKTDVLQRCLAIGIAGFLAKDMLPEDFVHAVRNVASGGAYVDPRVAGGLLRLRRMDTVKDDDLSMRELDIVRLIADGLSNKEISMRLFVSEKTIKNHTSRIFAKFGVTARTQVAVYALKEGIV